MKTKNKSLSIILGFTLISILKVSAQQGCFSNTILTPIRTEVQSANTILDFTYEPAINPCNNSAGTPLTGIGMNQSNPQYMLDILCTSTTNGDVNIGCPTCAIPNAVGYRIGGNYYLWSNGN